MESNVQKMRFNDTENIQLTEKEGEIEQVDKKQTFLQYGNGRLDN